MMTTLLTGETGVIIFGIIIDDTQHWYNLTDDDVTAAQAMYTKHQERIEDKDDADATYTIYFDDMETSIEYIQLDVCNADDSAIILSIMNGGAQ